MPICGRRLIDYAKISRYHRLPDHHRAAIRWPPKQCGTGGQDRPVALAHVCGASSAWSRRGYIEGYRAALRRDRIGLGFSVFVGVKLDGHGNAGALAFEAAVVAMPEVVACHLVSGEADYFLEVIVPDLVDYQRFLVGKLLNLPIVREVRSNIAIQTLKAGAPLPLDHLK